MKRYIEVAEIISFLKNYERFEIVQDLINRIGNLPTIEVNEENELKFYYVESIDDYWIGKRLDNFYYAEWRGDYFIWTHSRYLPWGEHVVNDNTLWKEHTYPSEPREIPFTKWIVGFMKKYGSKISEGKWIWDENGIDWNLGAWRCSKCHGRNANLPNDKKIIPWTFIGSKFCPNCGAKMKGEDDA